MYLYRSHMGGLYTSDEPLEYEELYCEQCGDSDSEIGYFDDDDIMGVWQEIKPSNLSCIGCEDDANCMLSESECAKCEYQDGRYHYLDILSCMEFFEKNMEIKKKRYVYLICEDEKSKQIFIQTPKITYTGPNKEEIPHSLSISKELDEKIAISLIPTPFIDEIVKKPFFVKTINKNGTDIYLYKCIVKRDSDYQKGTAFYNASNWCYWAFCENLPI